MSVEVPEPTAGGRCGPPRGIGSANVGPGSNRSARGARGMSSKRYEVVRPEDSTDKHVELVCRPLVDAPTSAVDRSVVSAANPAVLPPAVLPEVVPVVQTVAPTVPPVVVSVPPVAAPVPSVAATVSPDLTPDPFDELPSPQANCCVPQIIR